MLDINTRRKIYPLFFIFFIVLGGFLILRIRGLVIDWEHLDVVRTGGVYLEIVPKDAQIFMNGELIEETPGLISKGIFINDIIPGDYEVNVKKNGFSEWKRTLTVEPGIVSSASFIRLWEINPETITIATSSISDFYAVRNGVITKNESDVFIYNGAEIRGSEILLAEKSSDYIVTKDKKGSLFLTELEKPEGALNINEVFQSLLTQDFYPNGKKAVIQSVFHHSFNEGKIFILAGNELFLFDSKKITMEKVFTTSSTLHIAQKGNIIATVGRNGEGLVYDSFFKKTSPVTLFSSSTPKDILRIEPGERRNFIILLEKEGLLFDFNISASTSTLISENISDFILSPDEEKIAVVFNDARAGIFYLNDVVNDTHIPYGTFISLPEKVKPFWVKGIEGYVFFEKNSEIYAVETDPRTPQNTALITNGVKKIIPIEEYAYALFEDGKLDILKF